MVDEQKFLENIEEEIEENGSKDLEKVARKVYSELPDNDKELIELFDFLVSKDDWSIFWLVTQWIKRRELYELEYMKYYEKWLYNKVGTWGSCDVFCYRVLNPMVEKYPKLYKNILKWTTSSKTYVRRAAPVSLIQSTRSFKVNYDIDKVIKVAEKLKDDEEVHVLKGIGWLLKYAYLTYPDEVYDYLRNNVDNLPRIVFRYALEKAPKDVKEELMRL